MLWCWTNGTITEGQPQVVAVEPLNGRGADEVLSLAAAVERGSEHPLAAAIVAAATERDLAVPEATEVVASPGKGAQAAVEGEVVVVGNRAMMVEVGVRMDEDSGSGDGATVAWVAVAEHWSVVCLWPTVPSAEQGRCGSAAPRRLGGGDAHGRQPSGC